MNLLEFIGFCVMFFVTLYLAFCTAACFFWSGVGGFSKGERYIPWVLLLFTGLVAWLTCHLAPFTITIG